MDERLKEKLNIEDENPSRGANSFPYKLGFVVFAQLWGHNILFISSTTCKCQSLCHRTTNIKNRTYNLQTKVLHSNPENVANAPILIQEFHLH